MTAWASQDTGPAGCPLGRAGSELVDPGLYRDGDPHELWAELRRTAPVSLQATRDGRTFWSVTCYADADRVLRDAATFTSQRGTLLYLLGRGDPAGGRQMAATDPPRHTELREPLQRALAVKPTQARREQIRQVVVDVLAPLADGVYDLAEHMGRLPMAVIGAVMGLPDSDWPWLVDLTTASVAPEDPRYAQGRDADAVLDVSHRELFAYFHDVVQHRRRHPGDDLISLLLQMELDGRPLSPGAIVSNCYSLLLGANVTTAQVPVTALAHLLGTPELDEWASSPELLSSGVEEALRWATPTTHFIRYATRDVELRGHHVRAGDAVVLWLGSTNRDEAAFPDAARFDVRRRPNKHLAFGIGPHYCVGHTLARMTLRLLFAELFSRFTDVEPCGIRQRLYSNTITGWTTFPIVARPRVPRAVPAY